MMARIPHARRVLPAGLALAAALALAPWLEASMAMHMLVQLPLFLLAGWLFARAGAPSVLGARCDALGITGLAALLLVSAYWMLPVALELSLRSPGARAAKLASLVLLGWILPASLRRAPWGVQLFFLGNVSAMMAIAGIEYQSSPQRLCNAYAMDDQVLTGYGIVLASILLSIVWAGRILRLLSRPPATKLIP